MRRLAILFMIALSVAACAEQSPDEDGISAEIREIIDRQQTLWNEGDLEGFMGYYWRSEDFVFQSGNTRLRGWEELRSMYRRKYSGEKRGTLAFSGIDVHVQSQEDAYVTGTWRVSLADTTREGLFTLIFKKLDDGWRIVHDHSS
jgi:uncharacterized protein (TIGR02246 family)